MEEGVTVTRVSKDENSRVTELHHPFTSFTNMPELQNDFFNIPTNSPVCLL